MPPSPRSGSKRQRLSSDAARPFSVCSLTLVSPQTPVVCPSGFLFEKEAIVSSLVAQRDAARRATERASAAAADDDARRTDAARLARDDSFRAREGVLTKAKATATATAAAPKGKRAGSFWAPPDGVVKPEVVPKKKAACPMSGKTLRLKDLRPVTFVEKAGAATARKEYLCSVCSDVLSNSSRPAVLPSGTVLCGGRCLAETVGAGGRDPVADVECSVDQVIYIQSGGTAFSASAGPKEARLYRPSAR